MYVFSLLFAAAPFAFGLIRAFETGYDLRLLWMAFASFLGAAVVRVAWKARGRASKAVLVPAAVSFLAAMLLAGSTAMLLGATSAPGIWGIGFVFGACWAASYALDSLSRPGTI